MISEQLRFLLCYLDRYNKRDARSSQDWNGGGLADEDEFMRHIGKLKSQDV